MLTRIHRVLFCATLLGAWAMLGACSSSQSVPDAVEWTPSAKLVAADRYDYLRERQAKVLPLVVTKLSE
jgi:hypothetical protein